MEVRSPHELLIEFHRLVDEAVAELEAKHIARLRCGSGCSDCCVDGVSVFEIEADRIRRHCGDLLRAGRAGPEGACAFLDSEGACRAYAHRPYVCRTQGLPLRWIEEIEPGEVAELRDICPLNDAGDPPLEALPKERCWTIGPCEERLAALQAAADGGEMRRVELRALFDVG